MLDEQRIRAKCDTTFCQMRMVIITAVSMLLFGCGGSGSAARYDQAKVTDCIRKLDVDYLEPPRNGVFELSYSESTYGYGAFILVVAAAHDESAARHEAADALDPPIAPWKATPFFGARHARAMPAFVA